MSEAKPAAAPVPAATIVIVRDGPAGLDVFMVKRHHQIDFAAGALVFPGGKATGGDFDDGLAAYAGGTGDALRGFRACAIREAFEEAGILFARDARGDLVDGARLQALAPWRAHLERGEAALIDMLRAERLTLACDALVHYAHWVTPVGMPKRFDTHFFLAAAPPGQAGRHDGRESVDSTWIAPAAAVADRARYTVVFPTRLNLMKLAGSPTVAAALAAAAHTPPVTVEPVFETGADGQRSLRIRDDAGYEVTRVDVRDA